jgi:hypothetical protein
MISNKSILVWIAISFLFSFSQVSANPSHKNPGAPLDVHGTISEAKALAMKTYATKDQIWGLLLECRELKQRSANYPGGKLMAAAGVMFQARRDAKHLQLMGEPAGYDLERRLNYVNGGLDHYVVSYGDSPEGQKLKLKLDAQLRKSLPKLQKLIDQAQQMVARGQLEAFESLMEKEGASLAVDTSPFNPIARNEYYLKFMEVLAFGDSKIAEVRSSNYTQTAVESITENLKVAGRFQAHAEGLQTELSKSLPGAEIPTQLIDAAMTNLLTAWGKGSAAIIRAHAIAVAFNLSGSSNTNASTQIQQAADQLTATSVGAYASMIQMIATVTPPEKTPAVYSTLLRHLSIVQRRIGNQPNRLHEGCRASLAKLAQCSPEFPTSLVGYERATDQALLWRARFVEANKLQILKQTPSIQSLLSAESETVNSDDPDGPKIKTMVGPPNLTREASQVMVDAASRLMGKTISGGPALRISPKTPLATIPFDGRAYAAVLLSPLTTSDVDNLRSAIAVSETHGPLSIHAAGAVTAAEMQDLETIGGEIVGVTLESRLVRFATLPESGYALVPLGTLPSLEDTQYPAHDGICWRLDVRSTLAQSKYFRASKGD